MSWDDSGSYILFVALSSSSETSTTFFSMHAFETQKSISIFFVAQTLGTLLYKGQESTMNARQYCNSEFP